MIEWPGGAILLDVEGTTSAVAYVYDVMFPFAKRELDRFVAGHWDHAVLAAVREEAATDSGDPAAANDRERFLEAMREWMATDAKITALKQLQGLIWEAGFESGELRAHVFDDVAPALARWQEAGVALGIYSSGSVHAQKLFFGHTEVGDLSQYFEVHFDTLVGPKRDEFSYALPPPGQCPGGRSQRPPPDNDVRRNCDRQVTLFHSSSIAARPHGRIAHRAKPDGPVHLGDP